VLSLLAIQLVSYNQLLLFVALQLHSWNGSDLYSSVPNCIATMRWVRW